MHRTRHRCLAIVLVALVASGAAELAAASPDPGTAPSSAVVWQRIGTGFDQPVATFNDPRSGALLVVEQRGRIRRLNGRTVLNIEDRVTYGGERGLLDATFSPDEQRLFVHYSGVNGRTTLSSFPVRGALARPGDETVLMTIRQPAANHNGGPVVFGPDGYLYLALGDGGGANDEYGHGGNPHTRLGAILRLDVDSNPNRALPAPDNPFLVGPHAGEGHPMVWAHGLRNPWKITLHGSRWYVADVGQGAVEEVTVVPANVGPHDLGWPDWEGDHCRLEECETTSLQPIATLTHDDGACSIIGAAVPRRPRQDRGRLLFTDLCDHRVWQLYPNQERVVLDSTLPSGVTPLSLDTASGGLAVMVSADGTVWRRVRQ